MSFLELQRFSRCPRSAQELEIKNIWKYQNLRGFSDFSKIWDFPENLLKIGF